MLAISPSATFKSSVEVKRRGTDLNGRPTGFYGFCSFNSLLLYHVSQLRASRNY